MERKLQHFSHKHPLILKAEEHEIDDGTNHSDTEIRLCEGCLTKISGAFYRCEECSYFLHKVCAELPNKMNHPMHPQHPQQPLTLLNRSAHRGPCAVCNQYCFGFVYRCSICSFEVDPVCASASYAIEDKCHMHPLTPLQTRSSFPCHICRTEKKGLSYKCNICPFWVHQNCTVSLPSTIEYSHRGHDLLKLLQSVPREFENYATKCDICAGRLFMFHCVYYCERCKFCAHVSCARSKEALESSRSSVAFNQDGQRLEVLPVQQQSTDWISWFAENYRDRDPITNLTLEFAESYINRDTNIKKEIKFFDHNMHQLFPIDDQVSEKICDACAQRISTPSYGCIECDYFLHKCCTELPKQILHPGLAQRQIILWTCKGFTQCRFCHQWCNGFVYRCLQFQQIQEFDIDIKCASLLRPVKHEGHIHPLTPRFDLWRSCSACEDYGFHGSLKCDTCSFNLCFECAMAPPIMMHRYDKHPFKLSYFPPENHYKEYICELCLEELVPKLWHYHCGDCDQFTHVPCMIWYGADSNIKYGKTYKLDDHEHKLTLDDCTYDCSFCSRCHIPLRTGISRFGLKCIFCDFGLHLRCSSLLSLDK